MASVGQLFGSIGFGGGGMMGSLMTVIVSTIMLGLVIGGAVWWQKKRKGWNIKVEFKIPRNVKVLESGEVEGMLNKEWGKGSYDANRGVVWIKRKGKKPVPMKPFDIKRFLSTNNVLTVIQVGVEDYRPILDESYIKVKDSEPLKDGKGNIIKDEDGKPIYEENALIRAKIDTSESKSWRKQFERDALNTYSIQNWLSQHGEKLVWGFIIFMNLIGQAIVIMKLK